MVTNGSENGKRSGGKKAGAALRRPETAFFAVYAAVTAFMTYPAVTLFSRTYAERRDPLAGLWILWWWRYSFFHHLPASPSVKLAAPFGREVPVYSVDPLNTVLTRTLSILTSDTVAYNLVLLFSFLAAAVAAYYLCRYLTGNRAAAALAGLAFAFCPYMLAQGKEHLSLVNTMWMPLFLLCLLVAWKKGGAWRAALCVAVFAVQALFCYQYALLLGCYALVFIAALWLSGRPWRGRGRSLKSALKAVVVLAVVASLLLVLYSGLKRSPVDTEKAPVGAYQYSARPWDYVLPPAEGALLGPLSDGFIRSHLHGGFTVENTLFLGYVPLALAAYALVLLAARRRGEDGMLPPPPRQRWMRARAGGLDTSETRRVALAFTAAGFGAFLLSMPPTTELFGVKVYLPSYLFYRLLPQFRAYARFGVLVMLSVAVLASYGFAFLAGKRLLDNWKGGAALALAMVLVLLEFTLVPPFHGLDTDATTPYFNWLKAQSGAPTAALYPMFAGDDFYSYGYYFEQRLHEKTLVNGQAVDSEADSFRQSLLAVTHPATPGLLSYLGAEIVMVVPGLFHTPSGPHLNYPYSTRFDPSEMPGGYRLVRVFEDCYAYRVTAPPAEYIPLFGAGFYQGYVDAAGAAWHPAVGTGHISIRSRRRRPVLCDIAFKLKSARGSPRVTVSVNGEAVRELSAPSWATPVELEGVTLKPGENTLRIESDGEAAFLDGVPGYSDVNAVFLTGDVLVTGR